jgi:hypothetical protein
MAEYGWMKLDDGREVYRRLDRGPPPARSDLPSPLVISDDMDPTQSMLDGKIYTSKSSLRATYREAGVTEVGNDPQRLAPRKRRKPDRRKIKDTVEKAWARMERGERVSPKAATG